MKVIYINGDTYNNQTLTLGKTYDIDKESEKHVGFKLYLIKNDRNLLRFYLASCFCEVSTYREQQLDKLGI